jgi:hypothetical protein
VRGRVATGAGEFSLDDYERTIDDASSFCVGWPSDPPTTPNPGTIFGAGAGLGVNAEHMLSGEGIATDSVVAELVGMGSGVDPGWWMGARFDTDTPGSTAPTGSITPSATFSPCYCAMLDDAAY